MERFYETEIGQRYLEVADMDYIIKESQPVVGMSSTDLLPSFYDGTAWLYEGRYPTSEEYVQGSAVCLVPKELLIIIICLWGIRLSQDFILQMRKKRQTGLCQGGRKMG